MNCYRLITGMVLVICTINGFPAEQDSDAGKAQAEQSSGGVVIEYKEQAEHPGAVEESEKSNTTSTTGGTSVELIVGGSGEEGVAKRKEIPVRK